MSNFMGRGESFSATLPYASFHENSTSNSRRSTYECSIETI